MKYTLNWNQYAQVARKAVAESCVLIRNEEGVLPLRKDNHVAIFGRMQFHYIKSGTGSGGLVNAPYVVGILDAIQTNAPFHMNQTLLEIYKEWVDTHPFDYGKGWAQEPWAQEEMVLTDEVVAQAARESDVALVIIGRQAGEDRDNSNAEGSYLLTAEEERMLSLTTRHFEKVVVLLNVGNVMDMKWVEKYQPQSVLYVWQGGAEGGNGVVDILTGNVSPSGKLIDTIAHDISDYPSTLNFGNAQDNIYQEDIYVGYRYFETFAKEKVMYPFGFGLSYTEFQLLNMSMEYQKDNLAIRVNVDVANIGERAGKEVVQVYLNPPQGKLGKPVRNLVAFGKTEELAAGAQEKLDLEVSLKDHASYDDSGVTGHPYSYVLEAGRYEIYVGTDVRNAVKIGHVDLARLEVVEELTQACAPIQAFTRVRPVIKEDGSIEVAYEQAPTRRADYIPYSENEALGEVAYTGVEGYQLQDVKDLKITLDTFIAQLSDEELIYMTRGEGMCSPKVTPGTAGAIGGVTQSLLEKGIPLACCADGPSGIRLDSGSMAYSLPNGTALASTFNPALNTELFTYLGMEMSVNCVDTLLGPGINIHRNPLNGRNFEYFSEDPYVTGVMAVAQLKALHAFHVTGTIKHFACNNQEFERSNSNSVVSERALREIYLKGYERAVKEADAYSIMSSYGALNGVWTASNYDLLTTILRGEWNYQGIVMTDWWAKMNEEGGEATMSNTPFMIQAQNDVYMVVDCAETNSLGDKTQEALEEGSITRALLARGAKNICRFLMKSAVFMRMEEEAYDSAQKEATSGSDRGTDFDSYTEDVWIKIVEQNRPELTETKCTILGEIQAIDDIVRVDCQGIDTSKGASIKLFINTPGSYRVKLTVSAHVTGIAQVPVTLYNGTKAMRMLTLNSENCKNVSIIVDNIEIPTSDSGQNFIKLFFAEGGMVVDEFVISR